jgi:hypothetical protein
MALLGFLFYTQKKDLGLIVLFSGKMLTVAEIVSADIPLTSTPRN